MPKGLAKYLIHRGAGHLGLNSYLRRRNRGRLLAVCYHSVVENESQRDEFRYRNALSRQEFDRQIELLARCFNTVSLGDLSDFLAGESKLADRPALVTFDDGFRNNLRNAAPILEKYGVPAIFHLTTGHIGGSELLWPQELAERVLQWPERELPSPIGSTPYEVDQSAVARATLATRVVRTCKRLPWDRLQTYLDRLRHQPIQIQERHRELYEFLSWDEVAKLHGRGFDIGSHTISHAILTRLSPHEMFRELKDSKARLEEAVGSSCAALAYPNGGRADYSPAVIEGAREAGYRIAFTVSGDSPLNSLPLSPFEVNRVDIGGRRSAALFESQISGLADLI